MQRAILATMVLAACASHEAPRQDPLASLAATHEREGRVELDGFLLDAESATLENDSLLLTNVRIEQRDSPETSRSVSYFADEARITVEAQKTRIAMLGVSSADGSFEMAGPVILNLPASPPHSAVR